MTVSDNHARLYLAAYNMGSRRVATVLERRIWPKDYPIHVMRNYVEFYARVERKRQPHAVNSGIFRQRSRQRFLIQWPQYQSPMRR